MRLAKLGAAGAVFIAAILALVWILDLVPADEIGTYAIWAFGGLLVLEIAAFALHAIRGNPEERDRMDRPVP